MTKTRSTKRALLLSVLSLCLCVVMLAGTTFAWFTDSVTSENNIIKSGNLDIELDYWNGTEWKTVEDASEILSYDLWEPGVTEVAYLRVTNKGSLALKYQLGVNIVSEKEGTNVYNESFKLSDYIYFDVAEGVDGEKAAYANRDAAMAIATETTLISDGYAKQGRLAAGDAPVYVAMVVYMPTSVDNDANHNGTDIPEINLGINVFATQDTVESDSFDKYYDGGATWLGGVDTDWYFDDPDATEFTIGSAEELAGLAAIVNGALDTPSTYAMNTAAPANDTFKGKTITLASDIDLDNIPWIPVGRIGTSSTDFTYSFKGTFDGQNHTIYHLDVDAYGWAGVFGLAYQAEINNLKVDGVSIEANRMAGAVVGQLYGSIDNCHVKNADIKVVPNAVGDSFDNGDKVGGIVGWLGDNGNNRTLTNCSVTDVSIGAYRDVGGIAGYVASSTTVSGNKVDKLEITVDQLSHHYGDKEPNAGAIYGRTGGAIKEENNTQTNVTIDSTVSTDGITYKIDGVTGEKRLYLVPADYENDTLIVPEGVDIIENYAFAYNNNVKTVVLASTVTDLGRGFDSSTVEKVVLNEGLTTISSRAFRQTNSLKELVISSTVETVADNAFQSSAIKNIVFPENVKYIGDSCFTAATVETVTIMGKNVEIAHYAFRDCPKLTTVTILSDSITLGDGMIFTNSQNNNQNPNNITIYVTNEDVKAAIVANGTFMGVIKDMNAVVEDGNISGALTDGADTIYLTAGTYTFPASNLSAGDTIICAEGTVFNGTSSLDVNGATVVGATFDAGTGNIAVRDTINGTFKDCTFVGSEALRWCYTDEGDTAVFENCVIKTDFRGVHFDAMNGDVIFRNCEINGFNAIGGTGSITFENCTFGCDQSGYNGLNMYVNTTLTNCEFEFVTGKTNFIDFEAAGKTLTITNCKATLDGNSADIIDFVGGTYKNKTTITVDGVYYVFDTAALQAALDNATDGTTIQLASGVAYGSVTIRPTANNETTMYCETHDYTTTDAKAFKAHLAESGYHTTPRYTTDFDNVTIIGAEGATVEGIVVTSGHMYGDVYDYVLDKDYDTGSAYYNTLNLKNIVFSKVNFIGKIDINTSDAASVYDGVTFDGCTFTTGGTASANGPAIRYYNEANNGNVKNIVVKNSTFNNCYQGIYVHHVNGITVTGCTFDTIGHNAIAMQGHDGAVDLKNVVITGNTFKNIADRIIRFNEVGANSNITIQNNTATNCGDEDGQVIKATAIAAGITTDIKGNDWGSGKIVANEALKDQ